MKRRDFLSVLGGAVAAMVSRPLWGTPKPPGLAFHKDAFKIAAAGLPMPEPMVEFKQGDVVTFEGVYYVGPDRRVGDRLALFVITNDVAVGLADPVPVMSVHPYPITEGPYQNVDRRPRQWGDAKPVPWLHVAPASVIARITA